METLGGGWTTIQRRKSGLVSFYRDWKQYKEGFGSVRGDFWLGNENIHRLSRQPTRLRVELEVSKSGWDGAGGHIHTLGHGSHGSCQGLHVYDKASFPEGGSTAEEE